MATEDKALFLFALNDTTGSGDPVRAIGVQGKGWVTLDLATQEWRWMFYREKYNPLSQWSLFV